MAQIIYKYNLSSKHILIDKKQHRTGPHDNANGTGDEAAAGYDDAKRRGLSWKLDDEDDDDDGGGGGGGDTYSNDL